jgi:hypothetical protein
MRSASGVCLASGMPPFAHDLVNVNDDTLSALAPVEWM